MGELEKHQESADTLGKEIHNTDCLLKNVKYESIIIEIFADFEVHLSEILKKFVHQIVQ